jgi:hypothetical protein
MSSGSRGRLLADDGARGSQATQLGHSTVLAGCCGLISV